MEAYTYKCPGCGATLEFDPKLGSLVCNHCLQFYSVDDFAEPMDLEDLKEESNRALDSDGFDTEYMELRVYRCTSCGSEIMTNDVEVSKHCSYCGQPTIMYDRVSKEKKPHKIIPFSWSKENAVLIVRQEIAKARYGFGVELEEIQGIYMPYFGYEMKMGITLSNYDSTGKLMAKEHSERNHKSLFDASLRFDDTIAKQLEPFPIDKEMVDFNIGYLSGYAADKNEMTIEDRKEEAKEFLREIVFQDVHAKMPIATKENDISEMACLKDETFECSDKYYILCPVYFATLKAGNVRTLLLINGATGKSVGSIPINEELIKKQTTVMSGVCGTIFGILGAVFFCIADSDICILVFGLAILFMLVVLPRRKSYFSMLCQKVNSKAMFDLTKNRK